MYLYRPYTYRYTYFLLFSLELSWILMLNLCVCSLTTCLKNYLVLHTHTYPSPATSTHAQQTQINLFMGIVIHVQWDSFACPSDTFLVLSLHVSVCLVFHRQTGWCVVIGLSRVVSFYMSKKEFTFWPCLKESSSFIFRGFQLIIKKQLVG